MNNHETHWRYPGWRVVAIAAAAMVATLPGRTVGLGLITEPLLEELQVSRTSYATTTFFATILGALFSLAAGPAIDRAGAKWTLVTILLLVAATTIGFGTYAAAGSLILFLTLSRGFGQSALSTVSVTSVGKWFEPGLPMALGVFSALVALGFATVIPIFGSWISTETWRQSWIQLGVAIGVFALVTAVVMPRRVASRADNEESEKPWISWRSALRTSAFWVFTGSTAIYYLVLSGLTLFCEDLLGDLGFDHQTFILAMATMMGTGLIGNFAAGWLANRFSITRLVAIGLLLLTVVLWGMSWLDSTAKVLLLFAVYGVCGGTFAVLFFAGYARAFGQRDLGRIQGLAQVCGVIASALGPVLFAQTKAATASYLPAMTWLGPVSILFAIVAWQTPMPDPSRSVASNTA